ncbi:hypothetical protein Cgig2_005224 [Carnegiea gigantea]|uniref:CID domain-containing protein n=1 Tax=Carnegiea gigantea TaxID=171969 RepID=A0A9Q1QCH4_9CARY|nr:hypothetical protein Cgig2_005224 [Carnegiea gigantea]
MGSTFNSQILVDKLAKLNNSQQSIETLSHWCIFHMNKAKLVVETWERQFHCSPRERRLAFLYLANDILQNSRRKGAEFVAEFWRVLPEALRDVIRNGDDFGRNAALRLLMARQSGNCVYLALPKKRKARPAKDKGFAFLSVVGIARIVFIVPGFLNTYKVLLFGSWLQRFDFEISIWDERKVFGSRGHILKEEFMGRQPESNGRQFSLKLRQSVGEMLDKIVSDYEVIYGGQLDEDVVLSRCTSAISGLEKVVKEIGSRANSGHLNGSGFGEELQGKHAALRECIEQLTALETSRAILVSHLREALQEQAAQLQSEQAANVCRRFAGSDNRQLLDDPSLKEAHASATPPGFTLGERQSAPVIYKRQMPFSDKPVSGDDDSRKSTAAAVAAKLTASTASAEMLSHVLTSLVSGGIIDRAAKESPKDQSEKRQKLETDSSYAPPPPPPPPPPQSQQPLPPLPPFPHPDSLQQNVNTPSTNHQPSPGEQPPPPSSSPPPLPPLPPVPPYAMAPQFIQTAGPMSNVSYSYGATQQLPPPPLPSYTHVGAPVTGYVVPPVNPYPNFQGSEGGFYSSPSSVPMSSISHQQTL